MSPSSRRLLPLLFTLLVPLLAQAQGEGAPRAEGAGPLAWFWVAAIGAIIVFWTYLVLRKRKGPPPIDPTLRGPNSSTR